MKISLLAGIILIPGLVLAQSTTNTAPTTTPPAPQTSSAPQKQFRHHRFSPEKQLAFLTAKLNLSDIQQGEIKPLLVSRDTQVQAIRGSTSLTKQQRHQQVKALVQSTNSQIIMLLNPAQVPIFEQLHQHQHHAKSSQ